MFSFVTCAFQASSRRWLRSHLSIVTSRAGCRTGSSLPPTRRRRSVQLLWPRRLPRSVSFLHVIPVQSDCLLYYRLSSVRQRRNARRFFRRRSGPRPGHATRLQHPPLSSFLSMLRLRMPIASCGLVRKPGLPTYYGDVLRVFSLACCASGSRGFLYTLEWFMMSSAGSLN